MSVRITLTLFLALLCWALAAAQQSLVAELSEEAIQKRLIANGTSPYTAHFEAYDMWNKQNKAANAVKTAAAVSKLAKAKALADAANQHQAATLKKLMDSGMSGMEAHWEAITIFKKEKEAKSGSSSGSGSSRSSSSSSISSRRSSSHKSSTIAKQAPSISLMIPPSSIPLPPASRGGGGPHPAAHPQHLRASNAGAHRHRNAPEVDRLAKKLLATGLDPMSAHIKAEAKLQKDRAGLPSILGLRVGKVTRRDKRSP
jgi:hypothetical protein